MKNEIKYFIYILNFKNLNFFNGKNPVYKQKFFIYFI